MDLRIDIGTSEVKLVPIDDAQRVVGQAHSAVPISRPQALADTLGRRLDRRSGAEVGAARGAARLGRLARTGESVAEVCTAPPIVDSFEPDPQRSEALALRHAQFQRLYAALGPEMRPPR